jgi:hypothetical protein
MRRDKKVPLSSALTELINNNRTLEYTYLFSNTTVPVMKYNPWWIVPQEGSQTLYSF